MRHVPRRMQPLQFRRHRLPEQRALQTRHIPRRHRRLIYAVENAWNGGKVVRTEDLRVFEETERVACEVADAAAGGDDTEFVTALDFYFILISGCN